jgi:hypothetical protein
MLLDHLGTKSRNPSGYHLLGGRLLLWNHPQKFILWDFPFKKRKEVVVLNKSFQWLTFLCGLPWPLQAWTCERMEVVFESCVRPLAPSPLPLTFWGLTCSLSASPLPGKSHSQPSARASLEISRGYSITGSSAGNVCCSLHSNAQLATFKTTATSVVSKIADSWQPPKNLPGSL